MATTRERCLQEMHASWRETEAVLATIPPERMTEPGVVDEWSVRDLLAHIAGYERYTAEAILGNLNGTEPGPRELYGRDDPPPPGVEDTDDATNAWVVERARTLPLEDVLTDYRWAHHRLVEAAEACTDADYEDSSRLPVLKGKPLEDVLPDNCWGHHREHLVQVAVWLEGA